MAFFMDFHKFDNITIDEVIKAHMADLSVQEKYGVKYLQFWVNQQAGTVFCLTEGPDAKTCELVHQLAHGHIACAMTEVEAGMYKLFMGENQQVDHGLVKKQDGSVDLGYRNILVASIRSVTIAKDSKELPLLQVPQWAKMVARQSISKFHGREVKWDADDSLIGVFNDATEAVACGCQIQRELLDSIHEPHVVFKIGISADQPLTKDGEFFTKAIKLAHRLSNTSENNQILISSLVKKLIKEGDALASSNVKHLDPNEEQFVSHLLDITDQNLSNNSFSIESLCKDIGVSRPQLYRKITSITGRAPNDFLRDMRMEKALTLLKHKAGNIAQVALEVGYNNPSYFAKCFSEKFGCMPSEISANQYA
jgi:AraC-like DNA-binding protein